MHLAVGIHDAEFVTLMHSRRSHVMIIVRRHLYPSPFVVKKCGLFKIIASYSEPPELACDGPDVFRCGASLQFTNPPILTHTVLEIAPR